MSPDNLGCGKRKILAVCAALDEKILQQFGFRSRDVSLGKIVDYLHTPKDSSSLAIMRILFGVAMLFDICNERGGAAMAQRWGNPATCHFPLLPFLSPIPMPYMALVYTVLWLGAEGILLGYKYRASAIAFTLAYWYLFLVEKSFWNNHSYLFGLVATLLCFTNANCYWSVDVAKDPSVKNTEVPYWNYFILKYQFFILYFMAGLKKGTPEWLSGYSVQNLSEHWVFSPFTLFLTVSQTDYLVVHWFVFVFDLTVAFWMMWGRTRHGAILLCALFHLMNTRLFSIGMFPWVCLATMPLFYPFDWPKTLLKNLKNLYNNIMKETINFFNRKLEINYLICGIQEDEEGIQELLKMSTLNEAQENSDSLKLNTDDDFNTKEEGTNSSETQSTDIDNGDIISKNIWTVDQKIINENTYENINNIVDYNQITSSIDFVMAEKNIEVNGTDKLIKKIEIDGQIISLNKSDTIHLNTQDIDSQSKAVDNDIQVFFGKNNDTTDKDTTKENADKKIKPIDNKVKAISELDQTESKISNNSEENDDKPRVSFAKENKDKRRLTFALICFFVVTQLFLPFSHFITKGYNNWTNGLYGYSWDMMVHTWDTHSVIVKVVDNEKKYEFFIDPYVYAPNDRWTRHGDMLRQYARCIEQNLLTYATKSALNEKKVLSNNLSIYIDVWSSLNGRFSQRMFDSKMDLLNVSWSPFEPVSYLMPLLDEGLAWRGVLQDIKREVQSWHSASDVIFIADFPGYDQNKYISLDLDNVTLTVLQGKILFEPNDFGTLSGRSHQLTTGDRIAVKNGMFHRIINIGENATYFMYTFVNISDVYNHNVTKEPPPELPIAREFFRNLINMFIFLYTVIDNIFIILTQ